jgi:diacylglycerol kinase
MKNQIQKNFLKKRLKAFSYAGTGLKKAFAREAPFKIHLPVLVLVCLSGFVLRLSFNEWMLIILCFCLVLSSELFNTCIEKICDFIHPQPGDAMAYIKDVAAGAVLVCVISAILIGSLIFGKHLFFLNFTN